MPGGRFAGLSERLRRAGISPRRVRRLISELEAHFDDLVTEFRLTGLSQAERQNQTANRLETEDVMTENIITRTKQRSWTRRRCMHLIAVNHPPSISVNLDIFKRSPGG